MVKDIEIEPNQNFIEKLTLNEVEIYFYNQLAVVLIKEGAVITSESIRQQIHLCSAYFIDQKFGVIVDATAHCQITSDARYTLAVSAISNRVGIAIVCQGLPQRILANFYLTVNKPGTPTKLFKTKIAAKNWLKQFLEIGLN